MIWIKSSLLRNKYLRSKDLQLWCLAHLLHQVIAILIPNSFWVSLKHLMIKWEQISLKTCNRVKIKLLLLGFQTSSSMYLNNSSKFKKAIPFLSYSNLWCYSSKTRTLMAWVVLEITSSNHKIRLWIKIIRA